MTLTLDLRFAPEADRDSDVVDLVALAAIVRQPRELARLLWGSRWERVRVHEDAIRPSAVQAGALLLGAIARARRFEVTSPTGSREMGRAYFALRALGRLLLAIPQELVGSLMLVLRARRASRDDYRLSTSAEHPERVIYLRTHLTLRWKGAYVGGAATHTTGVINGFIRNGLETHVVAAERPEGTEGADIRETPLRRVYHLAHWLTLTQLSQDIVRASHGLEGDFVYQRYSLGSFAGLELARRLTVPLVLEYNGSEVWVIRHWGSGRLPLAGTVEEIERQNLRQASLIVVVSDVLKEELLTQGIPEERILVNPNGVDTVALRPLRAREPADHRIELGMANVPTIGFVGTFGLWHGVTVLPEMIDLVARARQDVRWILVGDGSLFEEVSAAIDDAGHAGRVTLTGIVPRERAVHLLAASDLCVSPHIQNPDGSRFFGSPTKLFEYMGLGKPIVASDLEQIGQVIDHERTGLLCPPGDAVAATEAVLRLLEDPDLCARLSQAAFAEAEANYSWDAHTQRILEALARGGASTRRRTSLSLHEAIAHSDELGEVLGKPSSKRP